MNILDCDILSLQILLGEELYYYYWAKMATTGDIVEVSQVDPYLVRKYIDACHILHYYDLVDAYGHISVRLSSTSFLMSRYLAPALVASPADLVVYNIEGAEPISPNPPRGMDSKFSIIDSSHYAC